MQSRVEVLELYKEYPPTGESDTLEEIVQITKDIFNQAYPEGKRPARRDQHAKDHGCVRGEFIVEPNLPEEMRFGVFREARNYPAWIRFSNGSAKTQRDSENDVRGMAIKLMGVEGEKVLESEKSEKTQDFLAINYPVFFVRNAQDYVKFFQEKVKGNIQKFFFPSLNPFSWRLHEFIIANLTIRQNIINLLEIQYWGALPYRLGSRAIQFSVKPSLVKNIDKSASRSDNYLREVMIEHLKNQAACFDFLVQFQTDPEKMPIEDPTIKWDEKLSPFQKVATIKIPPQIFDSVPQQEFCENLSYTPWHSLPEHLPLGGINRMRKKVYETISTIRHDLNHVPRREPSGEEVF